jgi:hypothetical protein
MSTATVPPTVQRKRDWIVDKIRKWASANNGDPPKVNDWRHVKGTEWPSYLTVIRYSPDGTWDGMIREAGFEPRGRGRPVETDE